MEFLRITALPLAIVISVVTYSAVLSDINAIKVKPVGFHGDLELWSMSGGGTSCFYINNGKFKEAEIKRVESLTLEEQGRHDVGRLNALPPYMIFCNK